MSRAAAHSIDSALDVNGDPHRRPGLLHRAGPDRDVLARPEAPLEGEALLSPGARDHVVGFLKPRAGFRQGNVVHRIFAGNARREAGDDAPVRHAVEHGELFGEPQRLMQRQEVRVDEELASLGALRRRRSHQVRRVHEPIGRGVMLVEGEPVEAQRVDRLPRVEMFGVGGAPATAGSQWRFSSG